MGAVEGHGVVEAGAHAADGAVAFEVQESGAGGFADELSVKVGVASAEGDVDARAVFRLYGVFVKAVAVIDAVVEFFGFVAVELVEELYAASALEPFQGQPQHVDGEGRRGVEHGFALGLTGKAPDGGGQGVLGAEQVFTHYDQGKTGDAKVFLRAGVDHAVVVDVDGLSQQHGTHVGNQRHRYRRHLRKADAVDGFVGAIVAIDRVRV